MQQLNPNPSFSVTMRLQLPNRAGMLSSVIQVLADAGGSLGTIDLVQQTRKISMRDLTVYATSEEHSEQLIELVRKLPEVRLINAYDRTFEVHRGGKISLTSKVEVKGQDDLAMVYTPGVGRVCLAIAADQQKVYDYTIKGNTIAVVTDGAAKAVLLAGFVRFIPMKPPNYAGASRVAKKANNSVKMVATHSAIKSFVTNTNHSVNASAIQAAIAVTITPAINSAIQGINCAIGTTRNWKRYTILMQGQTELG